jgi:cyclohexadienyl dehydratase
VGGAPVRFEEPANDVRHLVELADRRLALMPEVAAWKAERKQPVADPTREQEVLKRWTEDAAAVGLAAAPAREFLDCQIALARAVQEACLARWASGRDSPPRARDLTTELRPRLDALAAEFLPAAWLAATANTAGAAPDWRSAFAGLGRYAGVDETVLDRLARAAGALALAADPTWSSVRRLGVLRVGATGDYPPFSSDAGGELRGLDVSLAQALARHWGVRLLFVRTSWPTLLEDLERRRFEIAWTGITITDERSRRAQFSTAYFEDGKTPIVRCAEAERYSSLDRIDRPGVRVIVNPGGTNERFVRTQIRQATVLVHPDNRTIFGEIVAGRADVMFTDGIEVRLQRQVHPALCGAMAEPLTRAGKAVLVPQNSDLAPRIDAWLAPQVADGRIATLLEAAVREAVTAARR